MTEWLQKEVKEEVIWLQMVLVKMRNQVRKQEVVTCNSIQPFPPFREREWWSTTDINLITIIIFSVLWFKWFSVSEWPSVASSFLYLDYCFLPTHNLCLLHECSFSLNATHAHSTFWQLSPLVIHSRDHQFCLSMKGRKYLSCPLKTNNFRQLKFSLIHILFPSFSFLSFLWTESAPSKTRPFLVLDFLPSSSWSIVNTLWSKTTKRHSNQTLVVSSFFLSLSFSFRDAQQHDLIQKEDCVHTRISYLSSSITVYHISSSIIFITFLPPRNPLVLSWIASLFFLSLSLHSLSLHSLSILFLSHSCCTNCKLTNS